MATRTGQQDRSETPSERADRNLNELLGELRVALPGVQVLFAFLLIVPFNQRFADVNAFQETVYFATLLCTTAAAALLIAPSMHHRMEFRQGDKEHIVKVANWLTIGGLTLLAVAMTGAVVLITDFVLEATTTVIVGSAVAFVFLVLWYAMPLLRLRHIERR
jgi:Family of unknown function (DUF6328)